MSGNFRGTGPYIIPSACVIVGTKPSATVKLGDASGGVYARQPLDPMCMQTGMPASSQSDQIGSQKSV